MEGKMAAVQGVSAAGKVAADAEIHITKEDQQSINTFANKNAKLNDIKSDIEKKKKDLRDLDDAESDLLMLDGDDELIPFRIGEVFVKISMDHANELIEQQKEALGTDVENLKSDAEALKKTLADLKVKLYGKFGNSINLEEDED